MLSKWTKLALAVLSAVTSTFPETNTFTDSTLKKECKQEGMTADEVIFLLLNLQKISLDKYFCFKFCTIVLIFLFIDVERLGR